MGDLLMLPQHPVERRRLTLADLAEHERAHAQRLKLIPFDEIKVSTQPYYVIKDVLPRESLIVICGAKKTGKSSTP
jgi:hypothetical protein